MDNIKFKVDGQPRLLSYEELTRLPYRKRLGKITVVDLKSQRNYRTQFAAILEKFH